VQYNFVYMDLAAITRFLNGFLMVALPIALGIYLTNKFQTTWKLWLVGGAIFVISQGVHIPFNIFVLNPMVNSLLQAIQGTPGLLLTAVLSGLSAGIFEECARYGMFRWWLKDSHTWRSAVLTGAGHGGVEAILLGALVLWQYLNLMAVRNSDLTQLHLTPENLAIAGQQVQAYWGLPWYDTLLGALERIFTIPFHIMASVLVLQVFTRRPGRQLIGWLGLAILLHALLDASSWFLSRVVSGYAAEGMLGILALFAVIIIFALRKPEPAAPLPSPSPSLDAPAVFIQTPVEETSENLENTRFQ
jgi:uncharacterized membrane protein YhfC